MCALSALVVLLRLSRLDDSGLVIAAISLSPWTFLPLLAAGGWAAWRRRWPMAVVAVVVLIAPGWWAVTQFRPWSTAPAAGAGWPRLRILDANVTWTNTRAAGIAREVARDHPDIVALQEVTPQDLAQLTATGVFARYRWRILVPNPRSAGMALWSDRPLHAASEWVDAGHPELRARLDVGGVEVSLLVVHTFIPIGLPVAQWKQELAGIAAAAGHLSGPRIVVGDFNATWDMQEFQSILSTGLHDVAVESGDGWKPTWSPRPGLPAIVTIDHVLVSRRVVPVSYRLGPNPGSEHRSLLVTLAVSKGPPTAAGSG